MEMHMSRSDPIGNQKFYNLKFENPRLWTAAILNMKKWYLVSPMEIWNKILAINQQI